MERCSIVWLFFVALLFWSCDDESNTNAGFDRKKMLENVADNLIVPAFNELQIKVNTLNENVEAFIETPSPFNLINAQDAWKDAYTAWQRANAFNFGVAEDDFGSLVENIGTFPVDEVGLELYIQRGDVSFANFDRDTRGFLALEYLLFGTNSDDFTTDVNAQKRKNYLDAVSKDILMRVNTVADAWKGEYRDTFVNNTGTDAGSSTSLLFNSFNQSFESIKNFKLGLPLGRRAGQTNPDPTLVEAYYSKESVYFLKVHFENIERIWYGRSLNDVDGIGFEEYLQAVAGGEVLITDTKNQFEAIKAKFNELPDIPLQDQIATDSRMANDLLTEMQKLTRFVKSDMASLLGISITYQSGDGD